MNIKELQLNSPLVSCCSLHDFLRGSDMYVCEIIFTYCLQEECDNCPLANVSERETNFDAVKQAVQKEAEFAINSGYKKLYINLIGGDSFSKPESLLSFSEWLWSNSWNVEVFLGLTICSAELPQNIKAWIIRNKERIRISFRYNGATGKRLWENLKILHHSVIDEICICLSNDSLPTLYETIISLASCKKRIIFDYLDLESWNRDQIFEYIHSIIKASIWYLRKNKKILFPLCAFSCTEKGKRSLVSIDLDGALYPCRYCSPERMVFSALREREESYFQSEKPCEANVYKINSHPNYKIISKFHIDLNQNLEKLIDVNNSNCF